MKFFKWEKVLVVIGVIVGIVIVTSSTIRWPINIFPAIEGKILGARTGEPIENVVVFVNWIKSSSGPAGEITSTIKRDVGVKN